MNTDKTRENIEKYGWESIFVFDKEGERESFLYTIGLDESFNHPEIIVFGLKRETMHNIVSSVVDDIKNGFVAVPDVKTKGILAGDYEVLFKPVKSEFLSEYMGHATRYYQKPFRALVMFWPDKNHVFPFEENCEATKQSEALQIV